jgi:hypothetical protein
MKTKRSVKLPAGFSDLLLDFLEGKASTTQKWRLYSLLSDSTLQFTYDTVYFQLFNELENTKGGY